MSKRIAIYSGEKGVSGERIATLFAARHMLFSTVNTKALEEEDLNTLYSSVIFPGGHSVQPSDKAVRNIFKFVENGGGFIGICAGLHFAAMSKIINIDLKIVRAKGTYDIRLLKKHPVTRGYQIVPGTLPAKKFGKYEYPYFPQGRIKILRGNGGFIKCGKGVEMIASYDNDDEWGAIVAGKRGKGRVILFSGHPESSTGTDMEKPDPLGLLFNAVEYVSGTRIKDGFSRSKKERLEEQLSSYQKNFLHELVCRCIPEDK